MQNVLKKYQVDLKLSKNYDRDFSYLSEIFYIGKHVTDINVEEPPANLPLAEIIEPAVNETHDDDPEYLPNDDDLDSSGDFELIKILKHSRNFNMEKVCQTADRRGISVRDVSLIVTSALEDLGIVTNTKCKMVVDKSKTHRSRTVSRRETMANVQKSSLICFQFDGKMAKNLQMEHTQIGDRLRKKLIRQRMENIIIIQQPGESLLGFFSTPDSDALSIFNEFLSFFAKKNISLTQLMAVGCDGASTNTGVDHGVITRLEEYLGRPLHWIICMLHLNERTLGNVIREVDGSTTGPRSHSGDVMKELPKCHSKRFVNFQPISFGDMPADMNFSEFTKDQSYLLRIAKLVSTGEVDESLEALCPGPLNNSRWMTCASRLLREYVSTDAPTDALKLLARYVMKVYVPLWFQTKSKSMWYEGPKHLFRLVQYTRTHTPEVLKCVKTCVANNSFFAHPKMMLLCMIADADKKVRQIAYSKIIECRKRASANSFLRTFVKPSISQLNYDCAMYQDLLKWNNVDITEPPYIRNFSTKELKAYSKSNDIASIPNIPVHTQACEYNIQALTTSVTSVSGIDNQEGHLRNTMNHRQKMGIFHTKKDYKATYVINQVFIMLK